MSVPGTLALVGTFAAYVSLAAPLDAHSTPEGQLLLSLTLWAFLGIALALQSPAVRVQVTVLVVLATVLECVGSFVWGAYVYRLHNLPLYIPAGHGLFYLSALRVASLPFLERHRRSIVWSITLGATLWMLGGLVSGALPDLLGFVTWVVYMRFVMRGRYPLLYAVSFAMTTALEFYGTGLGLWRWSPVLPGLLLPAGNPPTGIGAGYCAMDALTRRIVQAARSRSARRRSSNAERLLLNPALRHP